MDNAKTQAYEQHFKPLIEQLHALAEQHKINFVCVGDIYDEETGANRIITSCNIDTEEFGQSLHAVAVHKVALGSPALAKATIVAAAAFDAVELATAAHQH